MGQRRVAKNGGASWFGSLSVLLLTGSVSGGSLYWDMNNNFPGATDDPSNKATGTWSRTLTNWSTDANGGANTTFWEQGSEAVFSASNDATAEFYVTVVRSYTFQAAGLRSEDSNIWLQGLYNSSATATPSTIQLTGAGTVDVASGKTIYVSPSSTSSLRFSGSVGFTKTGPGSFRYTSTNANTYTGPTRVLGGQLQIPSDSRLGAVPSTATAGNLVLGGGGNLNLSAGMTIDPKRGMAVTTGGGSFSANNGLTVTYGGIIADDPAAPGQALTKETGASQWILSGDSSFTGQFTVRAGMVTIGHANALGSTSGASVFNNNTTLQLEGGIGVGNEPLTITGNGFAGSGSIPAQSGALVNASGDNSYGGTVSLGATTNTISSNSGTLTLTNPIAVTSSSSRSLTLAGSGNGVVLGDLRHATNLTKSGSGTWAIEGNNAYTGTTTVNAGKLIINGQLAASAGMTTVKSGATLAGIGQLRDVTVEDNGVLAPGGDGPGTLSARNLVLNSSANLLFDLGGSPQSLISLTGDLTLDGVLNITSANMQEGTYRLIDYAGTLNDLGLQIGAAPANYRYTVLTSTPNQVNLFVRFSSVPEPAGLAVAGLAAIGLLKRRNTPTTETEYRA